MAIAKDPLLTFAKLLLAFFMGVMAFAGFFLVLAAFAVPVFQGDIVAELIADGKGPLPSGFIWALSLLLALIAGLLGMLIYFMFLLWRIIGTVSEGDPFVPANATRLSRMGWTAVAGNALALAVGALAGWIASIAADFGEKVDIRGDIDFGGGGLLMILVLFILARVFRHGSAMREDLEGTV